MSPASNDPNYTGPGPINADIVARQETERTKAQGFVEFPKRLYRLVKQKGAYRVDSCVAGDSREQQVLGDGWHEEPPEVPKAPEESDEIEVVPTPRRRGRPPKDVA